MSVQHQTQRRKHVRVMLVDRRSSMLPLRHFFFVFLFVVVLCGMKVQSKICKDLDIRNDLSQLEKLRNCTVIVGWLRILLLESFRDEDFKPYSFPELTEIKQYLIVYRVFGLSTLATLFPNLSVIRGDVLFENFALILFENPNLTEVSTLFTMLFYQLTCVQIPTYACLTRGEVECKQLINDVSSLQRRGQQLSPSAIQILILLFSNQNCVILWMLITNICVQYLHLHYYIIYPSTKYIVLYCLTND